MSELKTARAPKIKGFGTPRQSGEVARLRVLQGPDQGSVFIVQSNLTRIGRGDENQVVLNDLKVSREHGELQYTTEGWIFVDTKSANGFTHNREPMRKAKLRSGDTVHLGETVLEFLTPDQGTMMLTSTPKSPEQLRSEEKAFDLQRARVRALGGGAPSPIAVRAEAGSASRLRTLGLLAVAAVAVYFWLEQNKQVPTPNRAAAPKERSSIPTVRDLSSYVNGGSLDNSSKRTIEMFFREGMREFRQKNYLRARTQFESILQINPDHALAKRYLANSNTAIDDEIRAQLARGRRNFDAGKIRSARANFEAVTRLLARDPQNESYRTAVDFLKKVDAEIEESRLPDTDTGAEGGV